MKIKLLSLLIISFTVISCEFNQSVSKDLITGSFSKGDGISCDNIKMEVNGKIENRNEYVYGEKVNLIFNGITGLTRESGNTFPELSIFIVENEKDTVLEYQEMFADMEEGTDLSPLQLQANFVAALPYHDNEKYQVFVSIWDKIGDGTFQYEMPFTVKENTFLDINAQNLTYTHIYLWDQEDKSLVLDKKVSKEHMLILILEGLDGFEIIDDIIYPSFSIELTDSYGNAILSSPNILKENRNEGLDYESFKDGQLPVEITFPSEQLNNPCTLKASLTDLKSDRRIDIEVELIVE